MTPAAWLLLAQACVAGPNVFPTHCHTVAQRGPYASVEACRAAGVEMRAEWTRGAWQRLICERTKQ